MTDRDHSRLVEYLYGELPKQEAAAFERELEQDAALAAEARSLARALEASRSIPDEEPAAFLDARILAAAREAVSRAPVPWWRQWLAKPLLGVGLAATAAAVLAVIAIPQVTQQLDEPTLLPESAPAPSVSVVAAPPAKESEPVAAAGIDESAEERAEVRRQTEGLFDEHAGAHKAPTRAKQKREAYAEFPAEDAIARNDAPKGAESGAGGLGARSELDDREIASKPRKAAALEEDSDVETERPRAGDVMGGLASGEAPRAEGFVGRSADSEAKKASEPAAAPSPPPVAAAEAPAEALAQAPARDRPVTRSAPAAPAAPGPSRSTTPSPDPAPPPAPKIAPQDADRFAANAIQQASAAAATRDYARARTLLLEARRRLPPSVAYDRVTLRLAELEHESGQRARAVGYAKEAQWSSDPGVRAAAVQLLTRIAESQ
ncbi:MAG: hypothetical protein IT384_27600 [Deltaproteobacteria bacterium]|nr:hypothetical protein [Deltaproteobacteria bacterium]